MKILGLFIPGLWHVLHDRILLGLLLFAGFFVPLNAYLIWPIAIGPGSIWRTLTLGPAAFAWVFSTITIFRKPPKIPEAEKKEAPEEPA